MSTQSTTWRVKFKDFCIDRPIATTVVIAIVCSVIVHLVLGSICAGGLLVHLAR